EGVILKRYVNLGIAVSIPDGLIVPVVKDADKLGFTDLVRVINDLVERARNKQLKPEDVQGGTFTLNNTGATGSIASQPIINQPQAAILTTESIVKRTVVIEDAIAIRHIMNMCLSFDHRIVDGMMAGQFLGAPLRVAESVRELGLKHAVITSVDRDDLKDGGAGIFARTIRAIRRQSPGTTIEVLTPDFQGDFDSVRTVVEARPDIFNHNTETVPRLYARIRPKAVYANSLALLRHVKALAPDMVTKSGLMVGLGETEDELREVFRNMRAHNIDVLTVGQYLRPSKKHAEVVRYYRPEEFVRLKEQALAMGFGHVEAGPLVRSSYHADEQIPAARKSLLAG